MGFHLDEEYSLYISAKHNRDAALRFIKFVYNLVYDAEIAIEAAADWYIIQDKELYFDDTLEIHNRYELEDYFRELFSKGDSI